MLTPLRYAQIPDVPPYRTRADLSGVSACGLVSSALHAYLVRHRPCVVHSVEVGNFTGTWELVDPSAHPSGGIQIIVPVRWSNRARRAAVVVRYRANAGQTLGVAAASLAGVVADAGWSWGVAPAPSLPATSDLVAVWPVPYFTWRDEIVWSGDSEDVFAAGLAVPRLLNVSTVAGTVGAVVVTPSAAVIVSSVAVWEIADPEVTP